MGEKMGATNYHISGPKPFPKVRSDTMLVSMSPRASCTQSIPKIMKLMSFEGSRADTHGLTIPFIAPLLIGLYSRSTFGDMGTAGKF